MTRLRFEREPADSFYRAAKARVDDYFRATGKSRGAGPAFFAKAAVLVAVLAGTYTVVLSQPAGWAMLLAGLVFGFTALLLAINVGHDASHQVLPGGRRVNDAVQRLAFVLVGVDGYLWRVRHIQSHHLFPNVNGSDTDIDENPFVRLSPNQPWRPWFRWQHLYAPVAYSLAALYTTVWGDFVYLSKRELANLRDIRHPRHEYVLFAVCKLAYFVALLGVPLAVIDRPWWQVVLGFLFVNGCTSILFVVLLIGTHFADLADFPVPAADGSVGRSWADHNLATACDWSPHSRLAHAVSGGSNAHASHHLFPRVCHTHYPAVARIIERTAAEYGVRYNAVSLWGMVTSHFRLLYRLGRPPVGVEPVTPKRSRPQFDPGKEAHPCSPPSRSP